MKNKYVMISGFAFSEESDMKKLKNYASKGWILEDIVGGFFYKLKKDKPQDIIYTLDYQSDTNEEYFAIFKESGWKHVVSLKNEMHIFLAQSGTVPIYSDGESEIDKYTSIRNRTKKGSVYSLIIGIALMCLLAVSLIVIRPIFLIIFGLLMIDIFVFIFNFTSYSAYDSRIKQIEKYGNIKNETICDKICWKLNIFSGVVFLFLGISDLISKNYYGIVYSILGIYFTCSSLNHYKKYKKVV